MVLAAPHAGERVVVDEHPSAEGPESGHADFVERDDRRVPGPADDERNRDGDIVFAILDLRIEEPEIVFDLRDFIEDVLGFARLRLITGRFREIAVEGRAAQTLTELLFQFMRAEALSDDLVAAGLSPGSSAAQPRAAANQAAAAMVAMIKWANVRFISASVGKVEPFINSEDIQPQRQFRRADRRPPSAQS